MHQLTPVALAACLACATTALHAQSTPAPQAAAPAASAASAPAAEPAIATLPPVVVRASADASAQGLSRAYAGGQVARGGRAGILGTKDNLDTPFSITSYTNELIQDRQARSVGEVLQSDPGVRVARGFGNFQEAYFIRGFLLSSDDVAYNGLYSLLPRQYIATELFERVEVLRGASSFLIGANPGGGGVGGAINLLPKRAANESLTRVTVGASQGPQGNVAADVSRRFGPDNALGVRVNAAYRDGGTSVDHEESKLGLLAVALDWRNSNVRLSGDIGFQDNRLKQTRTNVGTVGLTAVPQAPESSTNWAQPWSYSDERDLFGTFRGEVDLAKDITAWAAYGLRRSEEANSLANLDLTNGSTGAGTYSRFDNTREDEVDTGELGLRGKLRTGPIGHEWVVSASAFSLKKKAAYVWDFFNTFNTNLYAPVRYAQPVFSSTPFRGNNLDSPALTGRTRFTSVAVGDTLSMLDDQLLVTLGARYQQLKVSDYAYDTGLETPYDVDRTSPVVGIVYKTSKQVSVYGNYIEGLASGPSVRVGSVDVSLAPSVAKQKEVGVKYDTGRLGLGASTFFTDRPRRVAGQTGAQGKDEHRGIEVTAYGQAFPELKVLGGFTWLDTKQSNTGVPATEGKQVIGVPKFQGTLGYEWSLPQVDGLALDVRAVHKATGQGEAAPVGGEFDFLRIPAVWMCFGFFFFY
ncbi:MAG: TonB-dependent receptor, partial [Rhizobacter sp.]